MNNPADATELNKLSRKIIGAAIEVHSALGPGLLESVYRTCMIHDLRALGMTVAVEQPVPIYYRNMVLEGSYRVDLMIDDVILVELKSVEHVLPVHRAQLLSYLRLTKKPLGLLINFNVPRVVQGISRMVNGPGFASSATLGFRTDQDC